MNWPGYAEQVVPYGFIRELEGYCLEDNYLHPVGLLLWMGVTSTSFWSAGRIAS